MGTCHKSAENCTVVAQFTCTCGNVEKKTLKKHLEMIFTIGSNQYTFSVQGRPGMAGRKGDKGDSVGIMVRSGVRGQ